MQECILIIAALLPLESLLLLKEHSPPLHSVAKKQFKVQPAAKRVTATDRRATLCSSQQKICDECELVICC